MSSTTPDPSSFPETVVVRPAASILVVADRPDLHVVIGQRRRSSGFVPGMIVFPGGAVDDDDRSSEARAAVPSAIVPGLAPLEAAAFLHAGLRETFEEVGLWVGGDLPTDQAKLPHAGWWLTPEGAPRRYDTHFFLARFLEGEVIPDHLELTDAWWGRPSDILEKIESGALDAIYPTVQFLERLSQYSSVVSLMEAAVSARSNADSAGWVAF